MKPHKSRFSRINGYTTYIFMLRGFYLAFHLNPLKLSDPSIKEDFNNLHTKQIIFLSYGMQGILDVWRYTGYEQFEEEVAKQLYKLFQTPMLQLHPTGERARELIKKHKEHNYFIEEYKAVH